MALVFWFVSPSVFFYLSYTALSLPLSFCLPFTLPLPISNVIFLVSISFSLTNFRNLSSFPSSQSRYIFLCPYMSVFFIILFSFSLFSSTLPPPPPLLSLLSVSFQSYSHVVEVFLLHLISYPLRLMLGTLFPLEVIHFALFLSNFFLPDKSCKGITQRIKRKIWTRASKDLKKDSLSCHYRRLSGRKKKKQFIFVFYLNFIFCVFFFFWSS